MSISDSFRNKEGRIKEAYDKTAEIYDQRYAHIQSLKYAQAVHLFPLEEEEITFDLGGGTGLFKQHVKGRYLLLDLSRGMIEKAKIRGTIKEDYVLADLSYLPFRNRGCKQGVSFTAYQNSSSIERGLKELERILKEKGSVFLSVLKVGSFQNGPSSLRQVLQKVGLRVKNCGELAPEDIYCIVRKEGANG